MKRYMSGAAKRKRATAAKTTLDAIPKLSSFFAPVQAVQRDEVISTDTDQPTESGTSPSQHSHKIAETAGHGSSEVAIDALSECDTVSTEDDRSKNISLSTDKPGSEVGTSAPQSQTLNSGSQYFTASQLSESEPIAKSHECGEAEDMFDDDVGKWSNISDKMRSYWSSEGSARCQHMDGDYSASDRPYDDEHGDRVRRCTKQMFYRVHSKNGEVSLRKWLIYSPTTGHLYCFACKLFSRDKDVGNLFAGNGFNDWRHASRSLCGHENSECHRQAMVSLVMRGKTEGRIDTDLVKQYKSTIEYWKAVLQRILDVIKFLVSRGLPLRGKDEIFGSAHNGNYIGILELLAKYDVFLSQHISEYANKGRGHTSYLSSTICEEFVGILGNKVLAVICAELSNAKKISVSVDSTPDVTHVDQLTVIVRYVLPSGPVERFLRFLNPESHSGEGIAQSLLQFFDQEGIDIHNCRGQSYDNASNMSGKYKGMQAVINRESENAIYIPCFAHSLNLVGQCAVDCCTEAVSFFGLVQKLYVFFSSSTSRWKILSECLKKSCNNPPTVKMLSETRWSARFDAVSSLKIGYTEIKCALATLSADQLQKPSTRMEAQAMFKAMEKLETSLMTEIWYTILERFNKVSAKLQDPSMHLHTAVSLLESLKLFVDGMRNDFGQFADRAKSNSACSSMFRAAGRRQSSDDVSANPRENFRVNTYLTIIDKLSMALSSRLGAYSVVNKRFGFLCKLNTISNEDISAAAQNIIRVYPADVEGSLVSELQHFAGLLKTDLIIQNASESGTGLEMMMHRMLHSCNLNDTFPNVEIILRIYLCLMVSNCSGERSFSKLSLVKSRLRASMQQDRLNSLALLSIEADVLSSLDSSVIIADFAQRKARKRDVI